MYCQFFNFKSLVTADLSGWDTSRVTNMKSVFESCELLASLDLSEWDTSRVTNISSLFRRCKSLRKITYGFMFVNSSLGNLKLDNYENVSVNMFGECPANKPPWVGRGWTVNGTFLR